MVRPSPEYQRYYNEGRMYLNSGEYNKAINSFDVAKLIYDNSYVYSGIGRAYYGLGKYEKALEYFEIAIKMYYSNIQAFHWRGKALGKLKRYDEAETQFNQTLSFLRNGPVNFYQEVLTDLNELKAERSGKPVIKKPFMNLNSEPPVTNIIIQGNNAPINLGGIQATDDAVVNRSSVINDEEDEDEDLPNFCSQCGKKIDSDSIFCKYCGARI